jgi:hypothetical protein
VERCVRRRLARPAAPVAKNTARVLRPLGRTARVTPGAARKRTSALAARANDEKRARAKRA